MIKMAGAFLIVGMTSIWGVMKADKFKAQLENLKYLQRIISLLQSEIRYSRAFMGEIFSQIGENSREPYRLWLMQMSVKLDEFTEESFGKIWKDSIDCNLKTLDLPEKEKENLKNLGNHLGYADMQVQMRILDLYQENLERTIREMHEQMQTKVKVYHCLGVMSGLFITVILL